MLHNTPSLTGHRTGRTLQLELSRELLHTGAHLGPGKADLYTLDDLDSHYIPCMST